MTKIDIFSGFLGAGKTTLIRKLLSEAYAGEKLVLIENEFGQIGIDGGFLKESGIEITEMNSGCICCSLVGDFRTSLHQVLEQFHPDRVLIEPSGVGKLSDVIRAVQGADTEGAVLNGFTTVVDAKKCKMFMRNFGEFFNDQIEHAGCIVLSHTQELSDEKIAACVALLREKNATATIVTTPWDILDGKQLLSAMEHRNTIEEELARLQAAAEEEHHHHHHDHECDDPECECHHHEHEHHHHDHECDDPECECHHHEHEHHHHDHECDDPECECHHHEHGHHHHDHECDDPECECHHHKHEHHHHDHECDDPECECHHHEHHHGHHHHHADEVFTSWGAETANKFTAESIRTALETMEENAAHYGTVLRAKGIVAGADGSWLHFDYIPGEIDIRNGAADVTGRLCVIGSGLDKAAIAALFGVM
ncbi:MAG: GTP-binding protein [Clostridia bacterium]|nr:GTP-binding protein [Clostridia bacterium]